MVRVGQGAHFFSDVVYSGLVVYAVSRSLHYLLFERVNTTARHFLVAESDTLVANARPTETMKPASH